MNTTVQKPYRYKFQGDFEVSSCLTNIFFKNATLRNILETEKVLIHCTTDNFFDRVKYKSFKEFDEFISYCKKNCGVWLTAHMRSDNILSLEFNTDSSKLYSFLKLNNK